MSDAALLLKDGQLFKYGSGKSIFNKKTLSNAFDSDVVVLKDLLTTFMFLFTLFLQSHLQLILRSYFIKETLIEMQGLQIF